MIFFSRNALQINPKVCFCEHQTQPENNCQAPRRSKSPDRGNRSKGATAKCGCSGQQLNTKKGQNLFGVSQFVLGGVARFLWFIEFLSNNQSSLSLNMA